MSRTSTRTVGIRAWRKAHHKCPKCGSEMLDMSYITGNEFLSRIIPEVADIAYRCPECGYSEKVVRTRRTRR